MNRGSIFAPALVALGCMFLFFPSLRVAGLIALVLGVVYWVLMAALNLMRKP
jgi:hypothetical protein